MENARTSTEGEGMRATQRPRSQCHPASSSLLHPKMLCWNTMLGLTVTVHMTAAAPCMLSTPALGHPLYTNAQYRKMPRSDHNTEETMGEAFSRHVENTIHRQFYEPPPTVVTPSWFRTAAPGGLCPTTSGSSQLPLYFVHLQDDPFTHLGDVGV